MKKNKVEPEFDCEYTDEMICPHCGAEQSDPWEKEWDYEECKTVTCDTCEKDFDVTVNEAQITYTTSCLDGEHDYQKNDWHVADGIKCARCGNEEFTRFKDTY